MSLFLHIQVHREIFFSHITSSFLSLSHMYTHMHANTHYCTHSHAHMHCKKNSQVAQLEATCPRSRCFISSRLFTPVCFTWLASEKYITVTLTHVYCIPNLNLNSALFKQWIYCSASRLITAPKRHYISVTPDKHWVNQGKKHGAVELFTALVIIVFRGLAGFVSACL